MHRDRARLRYTLHYFPTYPSTVPHRLSYLLILCFLYYSGLPIQVRDAALKIADEMPKSDVNKEYYTQNAEREVLSFTY